MRPPVSHAPHPALSDHPEFAMMLAVTMDRFRVTLEEVREDYWLGRGWRALAGDPSLAGHVARVGVGKVLLTGPEFAPAPGGAGDRARLERRVTSRLQLDTGHTAEALLMAFEWAEGAVTVGDGCMRSLLSQTVSDDARWMDLGPYAVDLGPVVVPVAYAIGSVVAA